MMKNLNWCIFILVLISANSFGQHTVDSKRSISLGANISANTVIPTDYYNERNFVAFNPISGFSHGVNLSALIPIKERWTLVSSLGFSKYHLLGSFICEECFYLVPPTPIQLDKIALEVPLTMRYKLNKGNFEVYAGAGFVYQGMLKENCDEFCLTVEVPQPKNLFARTELGVIHSFDERFAFMFNVHFDVATVSRNIHAFNRLGGTLGLNIALGK